MEVNKRILIVGAGNMATAIATALKNCGNPPVAVWSRTEESARMLGTSIGCEWTNSLDALPPADVVIISIVDSALDDVASLVTRRYPDAVILHTAGSVPMDSLRTAGASLYGVLYPMQTVNKNKVVPLDDVTVFIEGSTPEVTEVIRSISSRISNKVVYATSEQRCSLHVAAVFACNFPNAVYCMAAEILEQFNLPFDSMLPLIEEAARKVHKMPPSQAQTGPAKRGDINIMNMHKSMLTPELAQIYDLLSNYIMKLNK